MNGAYIAGFFDGEGSAMVVTIRRHLPTGVIYRFWPAVKIAQKTDGILDAICNYIGYGHVNHKSDRNCYSISGLEGVLSFVERIAPFCHLKQEALYTVAELAHFQQSRFRNIPYTLEDTIKMLDFRDKIFTLNTATRTGIKQKYTREQILAETNFVDDLHQWQLNRCRNGEALCKYAQKRKRPRKAVVCACGCGKTLINIDNKGRERRYVSGHNQRGKHWKWRNYNG